MAAGQGEYDLACFEAEQAAAQLALKPLLYELLGSAPRIHDLGEFLGLLHRALEEGGLEGPAGLLVDLVRGRRRDTWLLSDSYYRGRYGCVDYTADEADRCIGAAREVLRLVEEVRRALEEEA
ncbi:MAG: HEPN domain-containing protein [Desulfurococcales archaeon]|nr:HEPN domain-containing protein [Desulfurococcales archaeon]